MWWLWQMTDSLKLRPWRPHLLTKSLPERRLWSAGYDVIWVQMGGSSCFTTYLTSATPQREAQLALWWWHLLVTSLLHSYFKTCWKQCVAQKEGVLLLSAAAFLVILKLKGIRAWILFNILFWKQKPLQHLWDKCWNSPMDICQASDKEAEVESYIYSFDMWLASIFRAQATTAG